MEARRRLRAAVGRPDRAVRGPRRGRLGVAGGGRGDGQGPKGGGHVGPNPTDRGKGGVKRSLQVEGHGRPLGGVVAGANVPDDQLLEATIEAVVLERPEPEPDWEQHLALDAGFDTPTGWETTIDHDYYPHIAPRRPEDRPPPPDPP